MTASIGKHAPNFVALSTAGEIELYSWLGARSALIAFFADEPLLDALAMLAERAAELGLTILVVCETSLQVLLQRADRQRAPGTRVVDIPLVADPEGVIAAGYGLAMDSCDAIIVEVASDRTIRQLHRVTTSAPGWREVLARLQP